MNNTKLVLAFIWNLIMLGIATGLAINLGIRGGWWYIGAGIFAYVSFTYINKINKIIK